MDEVVDQMARLSSVRTCCEKWSELQQEVSNFYSDKPMERVSLSWVVFAGTARTPFQIKAADAPLSKLFVKMPGWAAIHNKIAAQ